MQILPLLALGLGADNVFVLVMNTVNEEGKEPHTILAENYQKVSFIIRFFVPHIIVSNLII